MQKKKPIFNFFADVGELIAFSKRDRKTPLEDAMLRIEMGDDEDAAAAADTIRAIGETEHIERLQRSLQRGDLTAATKEAIKQAINDIRAKHYTTQERSQEQTSIEKIRKIIGMAITDADFRSSLFDDVEATCRSVGLSLTQMEVAALRSVKEDAVKEFANSLDERISKFFPINIEEKSKKDTKW